MVENSTELENLHCIGMFCKMYVYHSGSFMFYSVSILLLGSWLYKWVCSRFHLWVCPSKIQALLGSRQGCILKEKLFKPCFVNILLFLTDIQDILDPKESHIYLAVYISVLKVSHKLLYKQILEPLNEIIKTAEYKFIVEVSCQVITIVEW